MENLFRDHLDYTRYVKQSQCVEKSKKRFHKMKKRFHKKMVKISIGKTKKHSFFQDRKSTDSSEVI